MQGKNALFRALAAAAVFVAAFVPLAQAEAIWHSEWFASSPPTLANYWPPDGSGKPSSPSALTADGDILFGAGSNTDWDYQFVRLTSTGTLRWVVNLSESPSGAGAYALIPNADGSAFLALGDPYYGTDYFDHIVRIDADGSVAWSRSVPTGWLVGVAPNRLASAGCTRLTLLDAISGNLLWQREVNPPGVSCTAGGVVADDQSQLYAAFAIPVGSATSGFRVIKFDAAGNELWNVADATVSDGSVIGVGGMLLYVGTATDVRALRVGDGSMAWSMPIEAGSKIMLSTDAVPEPIVIGATSTRRLAAESGLARWTQVIGHLAGAPVNLVGDAVVMNSGSDLVKLDAETGAIAWSVLAAPDGAGDALTWLEYGSLENGSFLAVAASSGYGGTPPPNIQRIDFATGASESALPIPSVAQSVAETNLASDDGHVVSAALVQQSSMPGLLLRSLDVSSGALLWQTSELVDEYVTPYGWYSAQANIALAGDGVAVTLPSSPGYQFPNSDGVSYTVVRLYDRLTGVRRWIAFLGDLQINQLFTWLSAPSADATGNVLVASSGSVQPYSCGSGCPRQSVYKLAAADGAVLWENDSTAMIEPQVLVVGSHVLLVDKSHPSLESLSDADGTVEWANQLSIGGFIGGIYPLADGSVIVTGETGWTKVDSSTGLIAWTTPYPAVPCPHTCDTYGACTNPCWSSQSAATLTDGDLFTISTATSSSRAIRLHNDGSGLVDTWPLDIDDSLLDSGTTNLFCDPLDQIWLKLDRRNPHYHGVVSFLTRFDIASGTLQGQQAIDGPFDDLTNSTYNEPLGPPAANHLLVATTSTVSPQPTTTGVAVLDTTVTAHGDLVIETTVDHAHVVPDVLLGFHITATYTGDQPISGANLMAYLPWQTGVIDLACATAAATNCVLDNRNGNVHASFDIQPGGSVDITGQVRMSTTESETPTLSELVYGPTGLSEQDTANNFATASVVQSLFSDGFDGR